MSKIVGLTGGIGSGKSTVAYMFEKLGVPIYISDNEAKILMENSKSIQKSLVQLFGKNAYVDKRLNRAFIASKVFNDVPNAKHFLSAVEKFVPSARA